MQRLVRPLCTLAAVNDTVHLDRDGTHFYVAGLIDPDKTITGSRWADDEAPFWVHNVCNGSQMINCSNNNEIFSFHPTGANFLYGDGSVRFHPQTLNAETFVSLFTRASGEVVAIP